MDFEEESDRMVLDEDLPSAADAVQRGNPAVLQLGTMMAPGAPKRGIDDDTGCSGPSSGSIVQEPPFKKARSSANDRGCSGVNQAPAPACSDKAGGVPRVGSVRSLLTMPGSEDAAESFSILLANYMLRLREEDRLEFQNHIRICNNNIFQCFTHFSARHAYEQGPAAAHSPGRMA